ncbi:MAG: hypothetical protein VW397_04245 [Candidatus Margulisiibacteriota bacterium]
MKKLIQLCRWFIKEERGNALLLTSASALIATIGIFFFTALKDMSFKNKERTTHLYNATMMAMSIQNFIDLYLGTQTYPRNKLVNNGQAQYSADDLTKLTNIHNFDTLTLETLESSGYIITHDDPTAVRELGVKQGYDKHATKIKIEFKLSSDDKVEEIVYLVNLAGGIFSKNAPYSADEPFFYLVSFSDDIGSGEYGSYDLTNNDLTLIQDDGNPFETILLKDEKVPYPEKVIILPGDED